MSRDDVLLQTLHRSVEQLYDLSSDETSQIQDCLVQVADAARDLSPDFRRSHQSVPWVVLAEMGAVLRRAGDDLDLREVSATLQQDLPELQQRVRDL